MLMGSIKLRDLRMRFAMQFLFTWAIVVGTATGATAQSRILRPQPTPTIRRHVTTLRSSDSAQGSRVTVSSDQSMSEYEAYRQGDKFYLRIPATDVPRVEAVHGRGFADVTTQNSGDKTLVAFRLRPGASAHVEQQGTHLDVVITVPGTSASTRPGSITPTQTFAMPNRRSLRLLQNLHQWQLRALLRVQHPRPKVRLLGIKV